MSAIVQSLARGLEMLRLVAAAPDGIALHEIADKAGLKRPAAHKLLNTLVAGGFLEKSKSPVTYRLGPAVVELGRTARNTAFARSAEEELQRMALLLPNATLTIARHLGGEVMIVLRMSPERPGFLERPLDFRLSPYGSASALLFQAYWTDDERTAFRRRHPLSESGGHRWSSLEEVDAFLDEVRHLGRSERSSRERHFAVAAPAFDSGGRITASVGASSGAVSAKERRAMAGVVEEAARRISNTSENSKA